MPYTVCVNVPSPCMAAPLRVLLLRALLQRPGISRSAPLHRRHYELLNQRPEIQEPSSLEAMRLFERFLRMKKELPDSIDIERCGDSTPWGRQVTMLF